MKKFLVAALLLVSSQNLFAQLEKGMIAVGLTSRISASKSENEYDYTSGSPSNYYYNYTTKSTTFNIAPDASYFISKRFAVGLQVGYTGYASTSETTNKYHADPVNFVPNDYKTYNYVKTTSAGTTILPYVKYYIPLSEQVYFLIKGSYGVTFSTGKTSGYDETTDYASNGDVISSDKSNEYGPNKTKTTGSTLGISPGILYMPCKKIGLEFSLGNFFGVNSTVNKTTDSNGNTSKSTTTGLQYLNFNTLNVGTGIYYFF